MIDFELDPIHEGITKKLPKQCEGCEEMAMLTSLAATIGESNGADPERVVKTFSKLIDMDCPGPNATGETMAQRCSYPKGVAWLVRQFGVEVDLTKAGSDS